MVWLIATWCEVVPPLMSVNGGDYNSLGQIFPKVPLVQADSTCTSSCCDSHEDDIISYEPQSAVQQSTTDNNNTTDITNVSFDDEAPGEVIQIPADIKAESPYMPVSAQLQKFLNRPVQIYNYSWTLGGTSTASFDPWQLYFNHTSIKKKIDNYYLIRAKLKLKFVINASPFHYGTLLCAYKPLSKFLTPAVIDTSLTSADMANVGFSQLPRVYVYAQTSQGGEMELPFLYPREWLDATTSADFTNMGTVYIRPMTALQFANSGTGVNVNMQVFAWAEDVSLSGPTVKLALQSAEEIINLPPQSNEDEYGSISGPASSIANMAGLLTEAPVIGPYATATCMAASAISGIAKLFGFTNVPVVSDVHQMTPSPFPMFASPEIGTQIEKLTLDPKNELTIDPTSVGIDTGDELLISNIVQRETYITQFPWAISNVVDDILFSIGITPTLDRIEVASTASIVNQSPMSMVSRMFSYWRGDIKLRLKFNCSQYHRGRVRISWDPVGAIGSTADSTTEVFTKIVDLAKCTDIDINIPYMQSTAFLNCSSNYSTWYANNGSVVNSFGITNGVLTVRVLTDLAAPLSTADIQCLVFVRGGDNLEFACPTAIDTTGTVCAYPPQSGFENYDVEKDDTEMGDGPSDPPSHSYLIYHGEVVKSLRTLIRRTAFHTYIPYNSTALASTADGAILHSKLSRYPYYPGFNNDGLIAANKLTSGTSYFNYAKWHPITWISQCFLGCRGAINYRVNVNTTLNVTNLRANRSYLKSSGIITQAGVSAISSTSSTSNMSRALYNQSDDLSGTVVTNTRTNTGLNFSCPYYSKYKFRTTSAFYTTLGSSNDDSDRDWYRILATVNPKAESNATNTYANAGFEIFVGAGTDYSPIFFVNVPTLYVYNSVPTTV